MKISTLGFPAHEQAKLAKLLPLGKNRVYHLQTLEDGNLPAVVLVFGEQHLAHPALTQATDGFGCTIAVVSAKPPSGGQLHIPYPLVASRVLRILDGIGESLPPPSAAASVPYPLACTDTRQPCYRVLVVDDSPAMQQALALELGKLEEAMSIDFADSGEAALQQTLAQLYDLIFLDIMMPGLDGFETCSRLRQRPALKKLPIIMLSSKTSPMDEVRGVIAGCTTYLTKPINPAQFQKTMQRITKWLAQHVGEVAA